MATRPQVQFVSSRGDADEPTPEAVGATGPASLASAAVAPVLVMNLYYTGIGIARNLRATGVPVHGISSEPDAPGMRSRLFGKIHRAPHSREDPAALAERLMAIRKEYAQSPVIFPTCDADVLFLAQFAHRLAPHYRLPPGLGALPQLMDKLALTRLAQRQEVAAPATVTCAGEPDLEVAASALSFPVVIKPRSAHEWRRKGVWAQVGGRKAILAETVDVLRREYRALAAVSPEVLIQDYVEGDDHDIVVCCCYIDEAGRLLGYFTGRKLKQNPPLFGTGCLVEACPVPEIVESSRRLLHGCGYSGIAEVEFKRDPNTGRYLLIEVNPRHWDQHQLGTLVGVNVTWIAYCQALGRAVIPCEPRYAGPRPPRWIAEREALYLIASRAHAGAVELERSGQTRFPRLRATAMVLSEFRELVQRPFILSIMSRETPLMSMRYIGQLLHELLTQARQARHRQA